MFLYAFSDILYSEKFQALFFGRKTETDFSPF